MVHSFEDREFSTNSKIKMNDYNINTIFVIPGRRSLGANKPELFLQFILLLTAESCL